MKFPNPFSNNKINSQPSKVVGGVEYKVVTKKDENGDEFNVAVPKDKNVSIGDMVNHIEKI